MTQTLISTEDAISSAKQNLVLSHAFFATIALNLQFVETRFIRTMAVDGVHLFYNPDFVDDLTSDELLGVIAHEVLHLALTHHTRRNGRDPELWNIACDHAINHIVSDAGFRLPAGALMEERFRDLSAEAIYAILEKEKPPGTPVAGDEGCSMATDGNPSGEQGPAAADAPDPGRCGAVMDAPGKDGKEATPAEMERIRREWEVTARFAAQMARSRAQGRLPAGIDRLIAELDAPKVDWRSLLREFVVASGKNDYSWTPPNNRYIGEGLILPRLRSSHMAPLVIGVDTSLSIGDDELAAFSAEINAIIKDTEPEWVDVVYCDADVAKTERFEPDDWPVGLKPRGGGGTDFRPVFDWIEEQADKPACVIYFTDLYGSFPETPPEVPTFWLTTEDKTAPFGETVRMDLDQY